MHYLSSDSLTEAELDECDGLLSQYVQTFENYFGMPNMSFNIHLMTHITDAVRDWGPTWVTDAYKFESWNKRIVDKVTSPNCRTEQIANRFLMAKFIDSIVFEEDISEETKSLIAQIRKVHRGYEGEVHRDFRGLEKPMNRAPTDIEKIALRLEFEYEPDYLRCFNRAKIYGNEYRCEDNKKYKFCNSTIFSQDYGFGEIMNIVKFKWKGQTIYGMFIRRLKIVRPAFDIQYMKQVALTDTIIFKKITRTMKLAVKVCTSGNHYCYALANSWTSD